MTWRSKLLKSYVNNCENELSRLFIEREAKRKLGLACSRYLRQKTQRGNATVGARFDATDDGLGGFSKFCQFYLRQSCSDSSISNCFLVLFFGVFIYTAFFDAYSFWLIRYIGKQHREQALASGLPCSIFDVSLRNGITLFYFLFKANNSFGDSKLLAYLRVWRLVFIVGILSILVVVAGFVSQFV